MNSAKDRADKGAEKPEQLKSPLYTSSQEEEENSSLPEVTNRRKKALPPFQVAGEGGKGNTEDIVLNGV